MNQSNLQLQSRVMDVIRWPLIVLVVFIHSIPEPFTPVSLSLEGNNLYHLITELISHNIGRIAVPTFFFISGYFFFFKQPERYDMQTYTSNLKKKARTLILPYLVWNFFYLALIWAKVTLGGRIGITAYDYEVEALGRPLGYHLIHSLNYPLWYLRDLICMNLIAPLIYLVVRYLRYWGILLLWLGYTLCLIPETEGFSATAIFYVSLGAYCGMYRLDALALTHRWRLLSALLLGVLLGVTLLYNQEVWREYLTRLYIPLGLVSFLHLGKALAATIDGARKPVVTVYSYLLGSVFFVYALHTVYIINWVIAALGRLGLDDGTLRLIPYLLTPVLTIAACLAARHAMRLLCPRVLALITGGRS